MFSDSIPHNSISASAPRDFGKKKRANRSAKLKQCKLDARREQWLSHCAAVKIKEGKEEVAGAGVPRLPANGCEKGRKNHSFEGLDMRKKGREGGGELVVTREEDEHENGSYSDSSFNSPTGSSILGETDCGTNFTGSSSSSSSSSSRSGCCSGSISEEEEGGGGEDNCLDDWEAVADALAADDDHGKQEEQDTNLGSELELGSPHEHRQSAAQVHCNSGILDSACKRMKPECMRNVPPRLASGNCRAWRPDDEFRPQSLPTLSKQLSFTIGDLHYAHGGGNPWACMSRANVPSSCPICCEELDCTDTSFLPCLCGFRLCLFCHKRILEEDGRCPGCRKPYEDEPVKAEASAHGGSLTLRLARSCSMNARS